MQCKLYSMDDSFESTIEFIKTEKLKGNSVVLMKGVFDLIHPDHIKCFELLKQNADILVVLIIGNKATARIKPGRPIQDEQSRMKIISSLKAVDFCTLDYDSTDPLTGEYSKDVDIHKLRQLNPDIWAVSQGRKAKFENYDLGDIKIMEVPEGQDHSTTKIIEKILEVYSNQQKS